MNVEYRSSNSDFALMLSTNAQLDLNQVNMEEETVLCVQQIQWLGKFWLICEMKHYQK